MPIIGVGCRSGIDESEICGILIEYQQNPPRRQEHGGKDIIQNDQ